MLAAHGGVHSFDVVYTDDQGEELSIRSEPDYREALRFCEQEAGTWRISLELSHRAPPLSCPSLPPGLEENAELVVQVTLEGGGTVDLAASRGAAFATLFGRWEHPIVTYVDEDGDLITVGSEVEWQEALRCAEQGGVVRVNVSLGLSGPLPAPACEPAAAGVPGTGALVINVRGTAGERMIRTTTDAPFEEVAALAGAATLEYVDDDGDTITCCSALEWREAVRFATHNSHGDLQLDVTAGKSLAGAEAPVTRETENACDSVPMTDEVLGEAMHGWLLARARTSTRGTPPPPSPLAYALKLAEPQEWDESARKLTLGGAVGPAAAVGRGPELFVTESCWGTISSVPPPAAAEASRRAKVTGSVLLQVAHGTVVLRQVDLRDLSASKVRASRGIDGAVVRCAASSSAGTLSVKINEDGVRLERGEELLIQYAA